MMEIIQFEWQIPMVMVGTVMFSPYTTRWGSSLANDHGKWIAMDLERLLVNLSILLSE